MRAVRREQPDLRVLRRAIIAQAMAEAAAEAEAAADVEGNATSTDAEISDD